MIRFPASIKYFVASANPMYALRGFPQMGPHIREAVARGKRLATGVETRPQMDIRVIYTAQELRAYLVTRDPKAPVFIDIETPRDNHTQIDIVGVSVSRGTAVSFWMVPEFGDTLAEVLGDKKVVNGGHNFAFDVNAFRKNGYKVVWPVVDTIQAEALVFPPFKEAADRRWLALATCVLRRFPGPYWKNPDSFFTQAYFQAAYPKMPKAHWPLLYCGLDVAWNWMLWERQREELEQTGMLKLYQEIVAPAGFAFAEMEDTGIPVDEERRQTRKVACQARMDFLAEAVATFTKEAHAQRVARLTKAVADLGALEGHELETHPFGDLCPTHADYRGMTKRAKCEGCSRVYREAGSLRVKIKDLRERAAKGRTKLKQIGDTFAATNDNHWRWLLFSAVEHGGLGLVPTRVTGKTGTPAVDKEAITDLEGIYPEVPILAHRKELKHRDHQMKFIYNIPVDGEGRAHFLFPLHRAENGRVASGSDNEEEGKERKSEGGNAQNITELDRQIFCAPPGYKWIEADGSQFELRVMAWLAKAVALLQALKDGIDIHAENAAALFGCRPEDAKKHMVWFEGRLQEARRACKRPTHGWDYGLGDLKCGRMFKPMAKKPLEIVKAYLNAWAERTNGGEGVNLASWDRRWRAAERSADSDLEKRKFLLRRYEEANTLKAREWRMGYFKRWPELARFQQEVIAAVTAKGDHTLRNPFGRLLKFWGFKWDYQTKMMVFTEREEALAFLPASTVGDMAKWYMKPLMAIVRQSGGFMVHMGHDSFSACVPDFEVENYTVRARLLLEREWPELGEIPGFGLFRCPFEFKIGQNWGPWHEHETRCKSECERLNPDGLQAYKEAR